MHRFAAHASAYRADIDGLRAIAVLLVLVFHFDLLAAGRAGFIGVDVFFVISGYLITGIVQRQLDAGRFGLADFYARRVRRLAPALFATLALTLAVGATQLLPGEFLELSRQALASQLYVANIYYWRNINYFGLGADAVYLLHMWSLAVEEQFYLLYPLLLMGLHRLWPHRLPLAIALGLLLSFALNLGFVAAKPEATFYLLPTRAWELLAGGWLASVSWQTSRRVDDALGLGGLALIAAAVLAYDETTRFPGAFALLPVAGAVAVIAAGAGGEGRVARALGQPMLAYVGRISYPLYLVHWPVHVFGARALEERYVWGWRAVLFALSIALAAALYHWVEQPLRARRLLVGDRRLMKAYGLGLALTLLVFGLVQQTAGLPQRFPDEVVRLAAFATDRSPPLEQCEFSARAGQVAVDRCRIGAAGVPARWMVIGDSHAWAAHAAFDQWLAHKGEAGYFAFRNSCPPLTRLHVFKDHGECFAFNDAVTRFLAGNEAVRNVVLVSTWLQATEGRLTESSELRPSEAQSIRLFNERFAATLAELHAAGLRVYVWEPVPGALGYVPAELARAALGHERPALALTRERYFADHAVFFAALAKSRELVTASFSPSDMLCQTGRCEVTVEGRPLYFDDTHVTRSSAPLWVSMMQRAESQATPSARR